MTGPVIRTGSGGIAIGPGSIATGAGSTITVTNTYAAPAQPELADAPNPAIPTADIFVSYSKRDRALAEPILARLRELALDPWIDDRLTPGTDFTTAICRELDHCRVQFVCWTPRSVESDWVLGEAEIGRTRGTLLPVMLEPCRLPPPHNMIHAQDLSHWTGAADHPGWRAVLAKLGAMIARPNLAELSHLLHAGNAATLREWSARNPADPFVTARIK